jgi:hypothetical protein
MAETTVPDVQPDVTHITYWYLRWLMFILPAVLLVVTIWTAIQQQNLERSISAYYGGPVRDVFVGVMIATAVCMIAYRGSSMLEDYTLNGAGIYATFVALVPSTLDRVLNDLGKNPQPIGDDPLLAESGSAADDYISFLQAAITTVVVLCVLLAVIELTKFRRLARLWNVSPRNKFFIVVTSALLGVFLVVAMVQVWRSDAVDVAMSVITRGPWQPGIHDFAAYFLIGALAVAVLSHAWPRVAAGRNVSQADLAVAGRYKVIFVLMLAGAPLVALIVYLVSPDHWTIFVEWWEIALFCVFWLLETRRVASTLSAE